MISRRKLTQIVLAACVAASSGAAYAAESSAVSVDLNYWKPSVKDASQMHIPHSSTVNLRNDLGLDKKSSLNLTVNFKNDVTSTLYIATEGFDFKNSKTLSRQLTVNDREYLVGDKISSQLKVSNYQIGLRSDITNANNTFYTKYQLNRSTFKSTIRNNEINQSYSLDKGFTSLGVGFGWETNNSAKVNLFAEITPISLFSGCAYHDYKIGIKTAISEKVNFTLGYKGENIRIGKDNASNYSKVDLRGLYFGLGGSF